MTSGLDQITGLTKSYGDHEPSLADRVAALIEAAAAEAVGMEDERPISDNLIALLDAAFLESFRCAPQLLQLLEQRGWTGWTDIRRLDPTPCTIRLLV